MICNLCLDNTSVVQPLQNPYLISLDLHQYMVLGIVQLVSIEEHLEQY
jgi:hypothetical protein